MPHPGGRPTDYRPEYCELLITAMKTEGISPSAFAGKIGVSRETVSSWKSKIPEFADAIKKGYAHRQYFWESKLSTATSQTIAGVIFMAKNVTRGSDDELRDRQDVELSAPALEDALQGKWSKPAGEK